MPVMLRRRARLLAELWEDQRALVLSGIFATGLVLAFWNGDRRELRRLAVERAALSAECTQLEGEVGAFNAEIIRVEADPTRLEREARERLLMGEPGEYLIPVETPGLPRI